MYFAVRDEQFALDIVQDAMMKLAEKYAARPPAELPMLFQRILQNTMRDHFRRQKVRNLWTIQVSSLSGPDDGDDHDPLETLSAASDSNPPEAPSDQLQQAQTLETSYGVYDSNNNCIYLTGTFYGTMYLDSVDTLISNNGFSNIYLAKMDLNGNFVWGKSFNNNLVDDYSYIYHYPNGNILIAGEIGDTTNFDTYQIAPGGFFAKFDTNGNCLWAAHEYSSLNNSSPSISFVDNDILFAGGFNNTLIIDTVTLNSTNGSSDAFITRMDSVGKIIWIKTFGFSGSDAISDIKVDFNKDIIISGAFERPCPKVS